MEKKIIERNYKEGIIDVEGSEEFVSKELDKFFKKTTGGGDSSQQ